MPHSNMGLRIHSYSRSPQYAAAIEYYRDDSWQDLTPRLVMQEGSGSEFPIVITRGYRQPFTAEFTLNNEDGLLSPLNETSPWNLNAAVEYDPLLDEARKIRIKQGAYCYSELSSAIAPTASTAPTAGALSKLTDGIYGDPTNEADTDFVHWSAVAANATIWLKIDLGSAQMIRHGMISLLSRRLASTEIELPASVLFEYSTDDATWHSCGSAFDLSKYNDSLSGQQVLAWFTDVNQSARYIRATITNINEQNEIYIDEFAVWGGTSTSLQTVTTFTGYLGDEIDMAARSGYITVTVQDARKKESDNRLNDLTKLYTSQRPEQIIYDLLTNASYWALGGVPGPNLLTNASFEDGETDWQWYFSAPPLSDYGVLAEAPRTGSYAAYAHQDLPNRPRDGYLATALIAVQERGKYVAEIWTCGNIGAGDHIDLFVGDIVGTAWSGDAVEFVPVQAYGRTQLVFSVPDGKTNVRLQLWFYCASDVTYRADDAALYKLSQDYANDYAYPLTSAEIGWASTDVLTDFPDGIPRWQGQNGTILEYIEELADFCGFEYYVDGDGIRQFYEPPHDQTTASTYLDFFEDRLVGPEPVLYKLTGRDIINMLCLVGYEAGNSEVPRDYRHQQSITRYGPRRGKIVEPLIQDAFASSKLARAILRDLAWAGEEIEAAVLGDFDIDRAKYVVTLDETVRAHIDKSKMWAITQYVSEMGAIGNTGRFDGKITAKRYKSGQPDPVAGVGAVGSDGSLAIYWGLKDYVAPASTLIPHLGGAYTGNMANFKIQIDGAGNPNTFKWSSNGGASWNAETVAITGNAQNLSDGVTVTFSATTGGAVTDYWTWIEDIDIKEYTLWWAPEADGVFTSEAAVRGPTASMTNLGTGNAYWFYVTATNLDGVESDRSGLVRCVASAAATGTEASTWGITDLDVALTDNAPTVDADLHWTLSLAENLDYIVVTVLGPNTTSPPTTAKEQGRPVPVNAVAYHYYAKYTKAGCTSTTTYYWRLAIYSVVIDDKEFHFGSPLYSNVDSAVWP